MTSPVLRTKTEKNLRVFQVSIHTYVIKFCEYDSQVQ